LWTNYLPLEPCETYVLTSFPVKLDENFTSFSTIIQAKVGDSRMRPWVIQ
jgi:hypothetical protein